MASTKGRRGPRSTRDPSTPDKLLITLQSECAGGDTAKWAFRLYVAGKGPNSTRALQNFKAVMAEFMPQACSLEVIDILEDPLRALSDGILVTPTLVRTSPSPITIIGNLNDQPRLLLALGFSRREV